MRRSGKEEKERGGWFGQPWLPVQLAFFGIVVEMKNEEDDDDNATENEMEQSFW